MSSVASSSAAKAKKPTRAALQRKILELEAQLASSCHFAAATLHTASDAHLMASGCLVQLTAIGGRDLIVPVMIRNGLSQDTIKALRADIARSWDWATEMKPKREDK